jgi:hypothetical protein
MRYLGLYSNKGCLGGSIRKFQKASGRGLELRQIFEGLHIQCDSQEMDTFAVIARRIWLRRNLVVHENSFIHPNRLVQEAVVALDEFWKANDADERPARQKGEITRNPWTMAATSSEHDQDKLGCTQLWQRRLEGSGWG